MVFSRDVCRGEMNSNILILAVHGTFAGEANLEMNGKSAHEEWWHQDHIFAETFIADLKNKQPISTVHWKHFQWSGANKDKERLKAAKDLFHELQSHLSETDFDRVVLLGHSHGGSVINYMLDEYDKDLDIDVYTIGTPFSQLHGLWRPFLFTNLVALFVAFIFSIVLMESIAEIVETRPHESIYKWASLHFWKLILPIYIVIMIGWRVVQRPMFQRYKQRLNGSIKNPYKIIYHPEDEAIAALSVIPERQYNFAFAIRLLSIIMSAALFFYLCYLLIGHDGSVTSQTQEAAEFEEYYRSIALMENAKTIFFVGAVCFFVPLIIQLFLGSLLKPFNRLFSKILNRFLYNSGLGNDSGRIKTMSAKPQLPSEKDFSVVSDPRLDHIFKKMVATTSEHLGETKTDILSTMRSGHDLFTALELNKGDLSKALVHCNYFTSDMATVIVDDLCEPEKPITF